VKEEDAARTKRSGTKQPPDLSEERIAAIVGRLAENNRVRRALRPWGKIHVDRQLPFLCVYRQPPDRSDPGADRLVVSEAAYLNCSGNQQYHRSVVRLIERLGTLMIDRFGAHLVLELWTHDTGEVPDPQASPKPTFKIFHSPGGELSAVVNALERGLKGIKIMKQPADVSVQATSTIAPPGMPPLISEKLLRRSRRYVLGLEVKPIFVESKTNEVYPLLLRRLKRQLTHVLDKAFYAFAKERTSHAPPHYHSLGRRAVVKAVWEVDERLATVSNSFDFLYDLTPINAERAWRTFRRKRLETAPVFLYRPHAIDPALMKRRLYDIRIERVEDPTLMNLFLEKQMELDRQLTMLHDRGTPRFRYESLQLHGDVDPSLVETAKQILDRTTARSRADSRWGLLTPDEFVERARDEIKRYARKYPEFKATVEISDHMYSGLMVSQGRLLVGRGTQIPSHRAEALIQHEVGTHLLTYFNGRAQPFNMLYTGLPGYDEMQEGLAVLAEYLVGGLTAERMRVLAARVIAARALVDGASFVDVFRRLSRGYRFSQRTAYTITMRVYRSGGLLKDAGYLRGLKEILKYISNDGNFNTLFVGKISARHIGVIEELLLRKILNPPSLFPRYLEAEGVRERLDKLRRGASVDDLLRFA
jgi:uncharacterized protein (TIGR02421 family)